MNNEFFKSLELRLSARFPVLTVETSENVRFIKNLHTIAFRNGYRLMVWNTIEGLRERLVRDQAGQPFQKEQWAPIDSEMGELEAALQHLDAHLSAPKPDDQPEIWIFEDIHHYLEEVKIRIYLRKLAEDLKYQKQRRHIILLSANGNVPEDLRHHLTSLSLPLPDREALARKLDEIRVASNSQIDATIQERLLDSALGMTEMEADRAYCLAWKKEDFGKEAPEIVHQEKEQIVRQSGILEYIRSKFNLSDVGGLEEMKHWLGRRRHAFSKKAREFHLPEPKGILLLGIPGCGKSLTAKVVAASWAMPLLRLDMGKVFGGIVGTSESNIRQALQVAETIAPCVLWIDEIEKGLAGSGGGGNLDSGVGSRVFSTLLTWMQEKEEPVFVIATANKIEHLPPELLRKGRFDEIFFVDLPGPEERKAIFRIHLQKRGQDPDRMNLNYLAENTVGFNGAEIESVVVEGLYAAFDENVDDPQLSQKHLKQAIDNTVILAITMEKGIETLRKWADGRARRASKDHKESLPQKKVPLSPTEIARDRRLD